MKTKFKILTYCGTYVDSNLLGKGIYNTSKPHLYDEDTTIESLVKMAEDVQDKMGAWHINEKYFESLKQCRLTDVELVVKNEE